MGILDQHGRTILQNLARVLLFFLNNDLQRVPAFRPGDQFYSPVRVYPVVVGFIWLVVLGRFAQRVG